MGVAMGRKEWAHKQMTKGAAKAYERGDSVYVHTLTNVSGAILSSWINKIESVGWRLENQLQSSPGWPNKGQLRWTLTFRRVDTSSAG